MKSITGKINFKYFFLACSVVLLGACNEPNLTNSEDFTDGSESNNSIAVRKMIYTSITALEVEKFKKQKSQNTQLQSFDFDKKSLFSFIELVHKKAPNDSYELKFENTLKDKRYTGLESFRILAIEKDCFNEYIRLVAIAKYLKALISVSSGSPSVNSIVYLLKYLSLPVGLIKLDRDKMMHVFNRNLTLSNAIDYAKHISQENDVVSSFNKANVIVEENKKGEKDLKFMDWISKF